MTQRFFGELEGYPVGSTFRNRKVLSEARVHRPPMGGISGSSQDGADSIVVSGGYEDDADRGELIIYTGQGGNDSQTGQQIAHQELIRGNKGLVISQEEGLLVRVIRGARGNTSYSPSDGYRYDGLYKVVSYWEEVGRSGFKVYRFLLCRCDPAPAPWEGTAVTEPEAPDWDVRVLGLNPSLLKLMGGVPINTIKQLVTYSESDLNALPGFYLDTIEKIQSKLAEVGQELRSSSGKNTDPGLKGKTFCFTGAFRRIDPGTGSRITRKQAEQMVEAKGGRVLTTVGAQLGYLVMTDPDSRTVKARKARELEVHILSEEEFFALLGVPISQGAEVPEPERGKGAALPPRKPRPISVAGKSKVDLSRHVGSLGLPRTTRNLLYEKHIPTLGVLIQHSEPELFDKGVTLKALDEIETVLAEAGLQLRKGEDQGEAPGIVADEGESREPSKLGTGSIAGSADVPEELKGKLGLALHHLYMSARAYACLDGEGVQTIGQLVAMSESDLLAIRDFGQTALTQVKKELFRMGLFLSGDVGSSGLTRTTRDILYEKNIPTLEDLSQYSESELFDNGISLNRIEEIQSSLSAHGLQLRSEGAGSIVDRGESEEQPTSASDSISRPVDDPEELKVLLGMPVGNLRLSVRAANCLQDQGINTIGQLVAFSGSDLLAVRNFGQTTLDEIKEKLGAVGLSLNDDVGLGSLDAGSFSVEEFESITDFLFVPRLLRNSFQESGVFSPDDLISHRGSLVTGSMGKKRTLFRALQSFYGKFANAASDDAIDSEQALRYFCAADLLPEAELDGVSMMDVLVRDFIDRPMEDFTLVDSNAIEKSDFMGLRYLLSLVVAARSEQGRENRQVVLPPEMRGLALLGENWEELEWRAVALQLPARAITFFDQCQIVNLKEVAELILTEKYVCPSSGKRRWAVEYPNVGDTTLFKIRKALGTLSELGLDKYRCGGAEKPSSCKVLSEVIFEALDERDSTVLHRRYLGETLESIAGKLGLTRERVRQIELGARKTIAFRFKVIAEEILSPLQERLDTSLAVEKGEALNLVEADAEWQLNLAAGVAGFSCFELGDTHLSRFSDEERVALRALFSFARGEGFQRLDGAGRVSLIELIGSVSEKAFESIDECKGIVAERDFQIEWPDDLEKLLGGDVSGLRSSVGDRISLHRKLLSFLGEGVLGYSALDKYPLDLTLNCNGEIQLRVYLYKAKKQTDGHLAERTTIYLKVPGQRDGVKANFSSSGEKPILLAGYDEENEVFILWDSATYRDFLLSRVVIVKTQDVSKAAEVGLLEVESSRRNLDGTEVIVLADAEHLLEAIPRRLSLTRQTLTGSNLEVKKEQQYRKPHSPEQMSEQGDFAEGEKLANKEEWQAAVDCFTRVIDSDSGAAKAFQWRGYCYMNMELELFAFPDLQAAVRIDPEDAESHEWLGHCYFNSDRFGLALKHYSEQIRLTPEESEGYSHRGDTNWELKRYEEAAKDYREALRFAPEDCDLHENLAQAYEKMGKFSEAREVRGKALEKGCE